MEHFSAQLQFIPPNAVKAALCVWVLLTTGDISLRRMHCSSLGESYGVAGDYAGRIQTLSNLWKGCLRQTAIFQKFQGSEANGGIYFTHQ